MQYWVYFEFLKNLVVYPEAWYVDKHINNYSRLQSENVKVKR